MNDDIRKQVRADLEARGLTISDVARELGKTRPQISRLLSSTNKDVRGQVPEDWKILLDYLGYEVMIRKKKPES